MEDLIEGQKQITIQKIVKMLNDKRLANKNTWVTDNILLMTTPDMTATIKYKMYNTWIQIFTLDIQTKEGNHTIKDGSPMDMKVAKFKEWIAKTTTIYLNTLWNGYGQ